MTKNPVDTTLDTEEEAPAEPVKCQPRETQSQESNFFQRLCFGGNFLSFDLELTANFHSNYMWN